MKPWQFWLTVALMAIVIMGLLALLGGPVTRAVVDAILWVFNLVVVILLLVVVFIGPFLGGGLAKWLVHRGDDKVEKDIDFTKGQHFVFALGAAFIIALVMLAGLPWLLNFHTWLRDLWMSTGWRGYETPPVIWAGYAFLAGLIGYYVDDMLHS